MFTSQNKGEIDMTKQYPVEVKCCVCKIHIKWTDFTSEKPNQISHGYCESCYEIEMKKVDDYIKEER